MTQGQIEKATAAGLFDEEIKDLQKPEELEIEIASEQFLAIPSSEELEKRLKDVERRLEFVRKVREFVMKDLTPVDFVSYAGRPYLRADGAEKFRAVFGISITEQKAYVIRKDGTQIDINDPSAFVGEIKAIRFEGKFKSRALGTEIEVQGGAKVEETFKDKDDLIFWVKKAQKNFYGYGIKLLLGLNSLDWETLKKFGINENNVEKIEFVTTPKINQNEAKELWDKLLDAFGGDENKAKEYLKKYFGRDKVSQLTEKQAAVLKGKIDQIKSGGQK